VAAKDRARGKAFERWVAARLGGRRRRQGEGLDFDDIVELNGGAMPISFECKTYAALQLRQSWVEQAQRNAGKRPWAIVQRPTGGKVYATIEFEFLLALLDAWGWSN
jgi:hypothetical protein